MEIYLDTLYSEPIGVLEVNNTGGNQGWIIKSTLLNRKVKGSYKRLYIVYKGNGDNLFNIDWFKFETK